jgi:hypothetical protein
MRFMSGSIPPKAWWRGLAYGMPRLPRICPFYLPHIYNSFSYISYFIPVFYFPSY